MQQEGAQARGPNGEIATFRGGQWVVDAPASQSGWQVQPMQTPSESRAQQDQEWQAEDRQRTAANEAERLSLARQAADRADAAATAARDHYGQAYGRTLGTADANLMTQARAASREAPSQEAAGRRAQSMLDNGAPTGPMADFRIMTGRALGSTPFSILPGIPDSQQTQQLEQLRLIGSQGALGDVGQLKGPLSEKELAFIQNLQINPNATPETNRVVANMMQWTARRQAAYGAAMERWANELGSPSATNADGLSFDRWWANYAAQTLPQPGTPEADALEQWRSANPGREAAVVSGSQAQGPTTQDPASGQRVSQRGVYNPQTGEIEWQ